MTKAIFTKMKKLTTKEFEESETPPEWIEYCEKNKDWIKNYSKDKEVKKIFEELGIKKWFDE